MLHAAPGQALWILVTKDFSAAGQFATVQLAWVPKAPRQQNWSLLKTVQGLRQAAPLFRSPEQALNGAVVQVLGDAQLGLEIELGENKSFVSYLFHLRRHFRQIPA